MNRKVLVPAMSVVLIFAVYLASNVILRRSETAINEPKLDKHLSDDGEEENYTNMNVNLSGKTVVIDSGHGGMDPGKTNSSGMLEKEINLNIALKLQKKLENAQINVIMTRTEDCGLYSEKDSNKKNSDLKKRCDIINQADIAVSIHQNSFTSPDVKGAQVFYCKNSKKGKKLAVMLQDAFREYVDDTNSRVAKYNDSYYILLNTKVPVVIAECGFLSNKQEASLLNTDAYQEKIADALYNGIVNYFINEGDN